MLLLVYQLLWCVTGGFDTAKDQSLLSSGICDLSKQKSKFLREQWIEHIDRVPDLWLNGLAYLMPHSTRVSLVNRLCAKCFMSPP
jgi:hypothetical protein